jgi:hypothetical protein
MALTRTTLAAACGADDDQIVVTSATGFTVGRPVLIENEYAVIREISGTTIKLTLRGQNGTIQKAHNILATVVTGPADEMPASPEKLPPIQYYSVSGAISLPDDNRDVTVILNKAGVAAMTLADPTQAMSGRKVVITSETAQAHTVTNTTGFNGASTSGDVATFGGAIGDTMVIQAVNGKWHAIVLTDVTLG